MSGASAPPLRVALVLVAAALLLVAAPAAASEVRAAEWHYLQRVNLISEVNQLIWKSFEDERGWDPERARYAREATHAGVMRLRASGPPVPELARFHRTTVDLLTLTERFYGALAQENLGLAKQLGERIVAEMHDLERAWKQIEPRYAPAAPASE